MLTFRVITLCQRNANTQNTAFVFPFCDDQNVQYCCPIELIKPHGSLTPGILK